MFQETFTSPLRVAPRILWLQSSYLFLVLLGVVASVVVVISTLSARLGARLADRASDDMTRVAALSTSTHTLPAENFAEKLPAATPSTIAFRSLQRACADAGVSLTVVQIREHASTPETLARLETVASLRGTYPSTHRALKEIADRYADRFTVTRLRIRRGSQVGDVLTEVSYTFWGAPAPDGTRR